MLKKAMEGKYVSAYSRGLKNLDRMHKITMYSRLTDIVLDILTDDGCSLRYECIELFEPSFEDNLVRNVGNVVIKMMFFHYDDVALPMIEWPHYAEQTFWAARRKLFDTVADSGHPGRLYVKFVSDILTSLLIE